mmetsp:Transcript_11672/g.37164  ORF Transcript_11672/g.37164 Transcript_11672/m.37164 type:complete len:208 (+) Transcript_11672:103-726(+)
MAAALRRVGRVGAVARVSVGRARRPLSASTSALSSILSEEVSGEKENLAVEERLEKSIATLKSRGATIRHKAGSGRVEIALSERVSASFDCRDVATEDDETEGSIEFDVKVENATGDRLIFECLASDGVQIDGVAYYPRQVDDDDKDAYDGPKFDELDPRLQAAFYSYLDERGVDPDLCALINMYATHVETSEYVNWLESVKAFVDG